MGGERYYYRRNTEDKPREGYALMMKTRYGKMYWSTYLSGWFPHLNLAEFYRSKRAAVSGRTHVHREENPKKKEIQIIPVSMHIEVRA